MSQSTVTRLIDYWTARKQELMESLLSLLASSSSTISTTKTYPISPQLMELIDNLRPTNARLLIDVLSEATDRMKKMDPYGLFLNLVYICI